MSPHIIKKLHLLNIQCLRVSIPIPKGRNEKEGMIITKQDRSQAKKTLNPGAPHLTSGAHDRIIWAPKGLGNVIPSLQLDA